MFRLVVTKISYNNILREGELMKQPRNVSTRHTIALVGNPNIGKTTIFNKLTGDSQAIGNWPGVTVEKKQGKIKYSEYDIELTDLPGIYSLTAYSEDEIVARNFILNENPHVLLNIIDGTNIERNLYLSVQLLEIGVPMVIAINMEDELKRNGTTLKIDMLSKRLNVPVINVCAIQNKSLNSLIKVCENTERKPTQQLAYMKYNEQTEIAIAEIISLFNLQSKRLARFFAIKMLEKDETIFEALSKEYTPEKKVETKKELNKIIACYESKYKLGSCESLIADARYELISKLLEGIIVNDNTKFKQNISDKIDNIVLNKYLAYPLFLVLLFLIFEISFGYIGQTISNFVSNFINVKVYNFISDFLVTCSAPHIVKRITLEAMLGGVGSVLTFLPQLALLFIFLALLEDSGYMARIVFIADKLLQKLGITGKSFISIIVGLGCTTSAVLSSRIIENKKERKLTMLFLPFISCSAKLPVYALIAEIFFSKHLGLVIFSLYFIGILLGVLVLLLFKKVISKTDDGLFLIELQPYKIPSAKVVIENAFKECKKFLKKVGTTLFLVSILIWFLSNFSWHLNVVTPNNNSILKSFGVSFSNIFKPLGFGKWQIVFALISGLVAKEAIVSSLSVLYGEVAVLNASLSSMLSPVDAYSLMIFILLYAPCVSAFIAMKNEFKSIKLAIFSMLWQILVAYTCSFIFFNVGTIILQH